MRYMACISKKFPDTTIHFHVVDHELGLQMDMNEFLHNLVDSLGNPFALTKSQLKRKLLRKVTLVANDMKMASVHIPPPIQ